MSEAINPPKVKLVPWWLVLIEGILLIIIGIFLLTQPIATWTALVWVIGLYWFISGIFNIIKIFFDRSMWGWKLFAGIVGIIAGYYLITTPFGGTLVFSATVVLMLGLFGIFIGIVNLIQAFKGAGWGTGILGVVSIILGFLILSNQQAFILSLPWAVGILAIIGGIIAIFNSFRIRSAKKELEEAAQAAQARATKMSDTAATRSTAATAATVGAAGAVAASAKDDADDVQEAAADTGSDAADSAADAADDMADVAADAGDATAAKAAAAVTAAAVVSDAADEVDEPEADVVVEEVVEEGDVDDSVVEVAAAAVTAAAVSDAADDAEEEDGVRLYGIDLEPDDELTAQIAGMFPSLTEDQVKSLSGLVNAVNSLDPEDAEKLRLAGIATANQLLKSGASRPGRAGISKETKIDESTVLKWVNDLDLKRIKGVGVKYSDLLETAGVDTVVELAHRNAANLYKKLVEVNEEAQVVEALPSDEEVADWVAQAKELPRVITY